MLCPFDHSARQRRIQRRKPERAILEHFDQLAARAEQQHRPELRINAAAENEFVAVNFIIGCTVTPRKCLLPAPCSRLDSEVSIAFEGVPHRQLQSRKIQLHAADIGLVCDRLGVKLEHDGITDFLRHLDRLAARVSHVGLDSRNAVSAEDFLGFELGENGAAIFARVLNDRVLRLLATVASIGVR